MQDRNNLNHQSPLTGNQFLIKWHRYKKLLLNYWWIIVVLVALSLGACWLWLRQLPPAFASNGQMIVNVKLSIPSETTYSEELENFFGTQVALMQSDTVINRVEQDLQSTNQESAPQSVKIQVTLVPKTSIFNLLAIGRDPQYTRAYLAATMNEYINLKKDLFANASDAAKSGIQNDLDQLGIKLQGSKQAIIDFQSSNSIVFLQADGGNSAAAYLSTMSSQLAEHQSELQLLKTLTLDENLERERAAFRQAGPASHSSPTNASSAVDDNAAPAPPIAAPAMGSHALPNDIPTSLGDFEEGYYQAKAQLVLLKANRDELSRLAPHAPELVKADEEIANQEKLLQMYKQDSEEQLRNQQHTLEVQITNLQTQIAVWQPKALEASKKLADFEVLKENSTHLQAMYDQLQASLQALDMDKGTGQESVTILEPPTPAWPVPPKKLVHMIMAGLIGLMAGIGILLFKDRLDDRPTSVIELEPIFNEPILGQIPRMKATNWKVGVPVLQPDDDRHMLVEAFQNLRSALIYQATPANHPRRIVISSASVNDGKSTVAANFAITLAQAGARVLLVDADLRRGTLYKRFEVPAKPGLAEVLGQQCDWSKAVVPTPIANLSLLPAGACPPRPGSLFAMHATRFLADIAGHYDYYVFDTPPITAADDVSNLAPHVDGLIMVMRSGSTSGRVAKMAMDLLRLRRINVIGLVLNAVPKGRGQYLYYADESYHPKTTA